MRWENPLTGELSQTPPPGPQPVQGWSRNDIENAASSRRSWLTPNQPSVGSSFRNITLALELNIDLANCVLFMSLVGTGGRQGRPRTPSMENSALLAVLTVLSEGQEWVPRGGTSSLPPQAAQSHAQALLWLGGAGQGEGTHSGTRQETGSFLLQGCPDPLLNTARRTLTPTERENRHNTAIFKSEGLCTLANATQGFRSEEAAWTPSVAHSRPEIIAKSQTARGGSLTTPRKNPRL